MLLFLPAKYFASSLIYICLWSLSLLCRMLKSTRVQQDRSLEFCTTVASRGCYQPTKRVIPQLHLYCGAAVETFLNVSGNLSHVCVVLTKRHAFKFRLCWGVFFVCFLWHWIKIQETHLVTICVRIKCLNAHLMNGDKGKTRIHSDFFFQPYHWLCTQPCDLLL